MPNNNLQVSPGRVRAIAIVRDSEGFIKTENFNKMRPEAQEALSQIIRDEGGITHESKPNQDKRFI